MSINLLMLDIDGVLALEVASPFSREFELLRLHRNIVQNIESLDIPCVIITHRSRREARHILTQLGLDKITRDQIISAETIFFEAIRRFRFVELLSGGLLKSHILELICKKYGVKPIDVAFVDDRVSNLRDLLAHGLGHAYLAPSSANSNILSIETFDFNVLIEHLKNDEPSKAVFELQGLVMAVEDWQRTGTATTIHGRNIFNIFRRIARRVRLRIHSRKNRVKYEVLQ